ncbi:ImmA/IrrE family metallo-endopeptidase [Rhizobium sp. SEMIA 4085]|uniref:IrrE N-terminal-like domain-containing protein n=1 Tax=Rhizobium gallicum bv. gallicum R602sp TaxID=1041138 RepID=A0A0B4X7M6_9HYPH|nr:MULTISPECIES: ImmA/IrrE family metallo-endopeptidase [Rhizobium]AJD43994.1 hypothetical protein RGR602_PB00465 [Rhizobium gallicum bv. gallicum R602sp]NNH29551.1 ImmA/IrrE family metallo-endopeptidase [Rhizobium sp. SEMIA 4085]TDW16049.1 Zn-dependent peptidase ImmA (M78 family) [Rhizobium azibense]
MRSLEPELFVTDEVAIRSARQSVPYIPFEEIEKAAQDVLEKVRYKSGPVDLKKICSALSIRLQFSEQIIVDQDGTQILGSANFDRKSIQVNSHRDGNRERFTLGHEIGHICLKHDRYLRSETIVERDLYIDLDTDELFNYERLEFQANAFASSIVLPTQVFIIAVEVGRQKFDIRDRGHGHIFVDDQPCNSMPYDDLLSDLSQYFEASRQAIEIKLSRLGLLNDQRRRNKTIPAAQLLGTLTSSLKR